MTGHQRGLTLTTPQSNACKQLLWGVVASGCDTGQFASHRIQTVAQPFYIHKKKRFFAKFEVSA
jgi:hypothetical protein